MSLSLIAYTDGSFNKKDKIYGAGAVLINAANQQVEARLSEPGNDEKALVSWNIAGELKAVMLATKKAFELGAKNLEIRHDYTGVKFWMMPKGHPEHWGAQSHVAKAYVSYMERFIGKLNITFTKVKAHSNDRYNDEADALAKRAANIMIVQKKV